jgi:hypothetical protein
MKITMRTIQYSLVYIFAISIFVYAGIVFGSDWDYLDDLRPSDEPATSSKAHKTAPRKSTGTKQRDTAGDSSQSLAIKTVTARKCDVRIDTFESKCDLQVELLDNRDAPVLYVTVKSIPTTHEIGFYTEHVGILVVGIDRQLSPRRGGCKNDAKMLRCASNDGKAVLEIKW